MINTLFICLRSKITTRRILRSESFDISSYFVSEDSNMLSVSYRDVAFFYAEWMDIIYVTCSKK